MASQPTISGIRSIARSYLQSAQINWWAMKKQKLSRWYRDWNLTYDTKTPPELALPRHILQRLIAIRTTHGDFAWYHRKFHHEEAKLECSCGKAKTPDYIVHCKYTTRLFAQWPKRPHWPPTDRKEGLAYLSCDGASCSCLSAHAALCQLMQCQHICSWRQVGTVFARLSISHIRPPSFFLPPHSCIFAIR